jgi:hypothetical protein
MSSTMPWAWTTTDVILNAVALRAVSHRHI